MTFWPLSRRCRGSERSTWAWMSTSAGKCGANIASKGFGWPIVCRPLFEPPCDGWPHSVSSPTLAFCVAARPQRGQ